MSEDKEKSQTRQILRLLAQGRSQSEILAILEKGQRAEVRSRQIGSNSENRVKGSISELEGVESVSISPVLGRRDRRKIDLEVKLRDRNPFGEVFIQVKSSNHRILDELAKLQAHMRLDEERLREWLLRKRLMFINGQQDSSQIQQSFLNQLAEIRAANPKRDTKHPTPHESWSYPGQVKHLVNTGVLVYATFFWDKADLNPDNYLSRLEARFRNGLTVEIEAEASSRVEARLCAARELLMQLEMGEIT